MVFKFLVVTNTWYLLISLMWFYSLLLKSKLCLYHVATRLLWLSFLPYIHVTSNQIYEFVQCFGVRKFLEVKLLTTIYSLSLNHNQTMNNTVICYSFIYPTTKPTIQTVWYKWGERNISGFRTTSPCTKRNEEVTPQWLFIFYSSGPSMDK